ncbi:hypothetical protein ACFWQG_05060 [Rhodococcus sp. NPDC058532]|uniref:hypothetical protein n=1 Tax=Rhodococcus sp. NPDC058532 TaxID=3346540 RepID=UPI0036515CAF
MNVAALTVLTIALLDGAFAGYRAAQGRTGRLATLRRDTLAQARGVAVWAALAAGPLAIGLLVVPREVRRTAAEALAAALTPFALVTLVAIATWCVLPWRTRYLAMAVVLGPMTLLRPAICVAGAVAVWIGTGDPTATAATGVAGGAQLLVEPAVGHLWYTKNPVAGRGTVGV